MAKLKRGDVTGSHGRIVVVGRGEPECERCPVHGCCYKSGKKSNLKRHIATHNTPPSQLLTCCGTVFLDKLEYRYHQQQLHRGKGYVCPIVTCRHTFQTRAQLQLHNGVHDSQNNQKCDFCDYNTSRPGNLRRHMHRRHMLKPEPKSEAAAPVHLDYPASIMSSGVENLMVRMPMPFKCGHCGDSFSMLKHLLNHKFELHVFSK